MPSSIETERPIAQPSVSANVLVPFLQAIILSVSSSVPATWLLIEAEVVKGWWPAWAVVAGLFFGIAFMRRSNAAEETLWVVERVLGVDLDGDKQVGEPIIIQGTSPIQRKRADFMTFLRAIQATGDTSRERFESSLGRARYEEFRDVLLRAGLAEWRSDDNHRLGWDWIGNAEEVIRQLT